MAPPRTKPQPEDSRSEASSTKEKAGANPVNGKSRRGAGTAAGGSSLRDAVSAGPSGTSGGTMTSAQPDTAPGLQWSSFDPSILSGYRYDYGLNTPAAFNKSSNQIVLSRSPIGRMSPTMAQRKENRRQSKDQLANSVRKHFNGMGIAENEVVVEFLYKVRWQDKNFRLRFDPRPR